MLVRAIRLEEVAGQMAVVLMAENGVEMLAVAAMKKPVRTLPGIASGARSDRGAAGELAEDPTRRPVLREVGKVALGAQDGAHWQEAAGDAGWPGRPPW